MITKEEYKKTLIRMWDSVRYEKFKGADFCYGVKCGVDCPIKSFCGNKAIDYYDMIEFVEKWGKEHPTETNGTRFLKNFPKAEVNSFDDKVSGLVSIRLDNSKPLLTHGNCLNIPIEWWNKEVDDVKQTKSDD